MEIAVEGIASDSATLAAKAFVETGAQREWRRCKPWIERAMANSTALESISDVEANVAAGAAVFWAGPDSAVITRFDTFPKGKALVIVYADGDGDKEQMASRWFPQLEDFARHFGCDFLMVECQEDQIPLMTDFGMKPGFVVLMKPLADPSEAAIA